MPLHHVNLFVDGSDGTQPVEVESLGDEAYLILHSPGMVEGVAAGDVVRVTDRRTGRFEVIERGGNLSIKIASEDGVASCRDYLTERFEQLGGRCDGSVKRGAVFTVPATAGFPAVESCMAAAAASFPGLHWWYGNVYGGDGEPLNWW